MEKVECLGSYVNRTNRNGMKTSMPTAEMCILNDMTTVACHRPTGSDPHPSATRRPMIFIPSSPSSPNPAPRDPTSSSSAEIHSSFDRAMNPQSAP
jgi:hypothetical protein